MKKLVFLFLLFPLLIFGVENQTDNKENGKNPDQASTSKKPAAPASSSQSNGPQGFEGFPWGTHRTLVKDQGGILSNEGENFMVFFIIRNQQSVFAVYHFFEDKLIAGNYRLGEPKKNPDRYKDFSQYLIDQENWMNTVTSEFGEMNTELTHAVWHNDRYKGDTNKLGLAMLIGDVDMFIYWDWPGSQIILLLKGNPNGQVELVLTYLDKAGTEKQDAAAKKEAAKRAPAKQK